MTENIKVRWLTDHEQTKVAPKTLSSQIYNEDGTLYKDTVNEAIQTKADKTEIVQADWNQNDTTALNYINNRTHWIEDDGETYHPLDEKFIPDTIATKDDVQALYNKLNSNTTLGFYCIEDVTIVTNGYSHVYPANSNVEIGFTTDDVFEIIPTSNNSILALTSFPRALDTFYPWLEGVKQFSNILFDMNDEAMYSKWSQGNQGAYQVQFAQYSNCIFWSDNPYISDVTRRTNYTLCSTTQLPLCYSTIPENTFKSFYLAMSVNSDPNWGNPLYKESFANANWATQVFSYYGARVVGFPGHDSPNFNITLPKDCRGLMFDARNIECAGTFDAVNTTNFGAKSGSWRDAFGYCPSLRRLYIKNLKVNLNISWSPVDYDSIYFIISEATNTSAIKISVSPYTYNLLKTSDFELATSKNITIELITTNYVEDRRLNTIPNNLVNGSAAGSLKGINTLAEDNTYTMGENAFAIGNGTKAAGNNSFASGQDVEATGSYSHAEGYGTYATAAAAHAEGYDTHATARYAHAEGASTTASGNNSHAEGNSTTASGHYSHAEGNFTTSAGGYSHAEGNYAQTGEDGTYAHAEGSNTKALKTGAHAEGNYTEANAVFAHTEGYYTKAGSPYQHVRGKYNIVDENNTYSTIIGNGDADTNRKNIHTLNWNGEAWFSGDIYVGSTSGTDKDEGSKKLATEEYVSEAIDAISLSGTLQFGGMVEELPATSEVGTVVLFGTKEYVYNTDNTWRELGDEGSYALKTVTITAGSGLTGGGTLETNRTISHSNVITAGTTQGSNTTLNAGGKIRIPTISYDSNGHITSAGVTEATLPNSAMYDIVNNEIYTTYLRKYEAGKRIISADSQTPIRFQSKSTHGALIEFANEAGTSQGYLGIYDDKPSYYKTDRAYTLLHEGNYKDVVEVDVSKLTQDEEVTLILDCND